MKFMVVENFFNNFSQIEDEFKKIQRYDYEKHPDIKPKLGNKEFLKYKWPGQRSEDLKKTNKFLTALFLKEYEEKFKDFFDEKLGFAIYTHLRLSDTNKDDFLHKDTPDSTYSLLVYLSETNLNSGTKLFDDFDKEVADIKFVQNRAVIFDSRYTHLANNNHGDNEDNGRLTLNVFWKRG